MPHLLLWLEAPLQAWGSGSRFARRETEPFPTLSGVLGLLCCARGASGPEEAWLAAWSPSRFWVDAYPRKSARAPELTDFQMVGSGYDEDDPWQTLMIPRTADGKKAVSGGTKMTQRAYLQDMAFAVILEATAEQAREAEAALSSPVWPLYLGRKCCAPSDWVFRGCHANLEQARAAGEAIAQAKGRVPGFHVRPPLPGEAGGQILTDVPVRFGLQKVYGQRTVAIDDAMAPL